MTKMLIISCIIVLIAAGCAMDGTFRITAEHFPISMVEKDDPEKSYGEAAFDKISEGNFRRRTLGWKDRAT